MNNESCCYFCKLKKSDRLQLYCYCLSNLGVLSTYHSYDINYNLIRSIIEYKDFEISISFYRNKTIYYHYIRHPKGEYIKTPLTLSGTNYSIEYLLNKADMISLFS